MGDIFGYRRDFNKMFERSERMEKYYLDKAIEYLKYCNEHSNKKQQ